MHKLEEFKQRKSHEKVVLASSNLTSSKKPVKITFRRKKLPVNEPINRFRKLTLMIIQLNQAVSSIKKRVNKEKISVQVNVYNTDGIVFDVNHYKRQKGKSLTDDVLKTLRHIEPKNRTEDQLNNILVSLIECVPEYLDFPTKIRKEIARASSYQEFESGRVIIRQNHKADNFYFIVSGIAAVLKAEYDFVTNEACNKTVAYLSKGKSFGELAIMHASARNATVVCHTDVSVLSIGRDDFVNIFMHTEGDEEPEFISFLRQVDLFDHWPIEKLPYNNPNICLLTFFRRGVVMCKDSSNSDWIYCVKLGTCRVIKKICQNETSKPRRFSQFSKNSEVNTNLSSNNDNFIEVKKLHSKETFGLTEVLFDKSEGGFSCSMISEGAECILINKEFFLNYLTDNYRNQLKKMVTPYPTDLSLEKKIQTNSDWEKYKKQAFKEIISARKKIAENKKYLNHNRI